MSYRWLPFRFRLAFRALRLLMSPAARARHDWQLRFQEQVEFNLLSHLPADFPTSGRHEFEWRGVFFDCADPDVRHLFAMKALAASGRSGRAVRVHWRMENTWGAAQWT